MATRRKNKSRWLSQTALGLALIFGVGTTGCDPASYLSRNMCYVFDCDTLFFIEELLPLSLRPMGGGGGGTTATAAPEAAEPEGGGHAH